MPTLDNQTNSASYSGITNSSRNVNHTVNTADNTNVYVMVSLDAATVTGITCAGSNMTQIGTTQSIGGRSTSFYYITGVSSGVNQVSITFSGNSYYAISVYSFTDCDNGSPVTQTQSSTGTASTLSITPTITSSLVLSFLNTSSTNTSMSGSDSQTTTTLTMNSGATPHQMLTGYRTGISNTATDDRYSWTHSGDFYQTSIAVAPAQPPPELEQEGFRFRDDDGSETTATWLAAQDTPITRAIETATRLRVLVNGTHDPLSAAFQLEYKKSIDSTWSKVGQSTEIDDNYPVVEEVVKGGTTTTNTTSHVITMPTTINPGDLLLIVFSVDGNPTLVTPTGWTRLGRESNGNTVTGVIYFKRAEGGDTATVTSGIAEQSTHIVYRISNAAPPIISAANGNSTNSNPPNNNTGTSRKYLWIATRSGDSTVVATVEPSGYSSLQTETASGTGGASTNTAIKTATASSEDPGTFTSAAENWACFTVALAPRYSYELMLGNDATGSNDTTVGTLAWSNPTNITDSDDARATRTLSGFGITNYVRASALGLAVPTDATIIGIHTTVEKIRSGGTAGQARDSSVRLFKSTGVVGDDKADTATNWTAQEDTFVYGGAGDLWGTTWTPAEVNHADFGVGFAATGSTSGTDRIVSVDQIRVFIYYTVPPVPPVFDLSASANITASGDNTTAQLTAPSGRTTGDFQTGRMQDDENPADAIDLTSDKYTELEWSIEATSEAVDYGVYQFRVTNNGVVLDTYSVTPEWTIDTTAPTAVTHISTTTPSTGASVNSLTFACTVDYGLNRLLVVPIQIFSDVSQAERTVTSVTYGGVSLTRLIRQDQGNIGCEIWYLINPAVGTANVVATLGGTNAWSIAAASVYTGVDQSTPFEDSESVVGGTQTLTAAVTTITDNSMLVDSMVKYSASETLTADAGQNSRYSTTVGAGFGLAGGSSDELQAVAGVESTTWNWTTTNRDSALAVGVMKFADGGGGSSPTQNGKFFHFI